VAGRDVGDGGDEDGEEDRRQPALHVEPEDRPPGRMAVEENLLCIHRGSG
jgi:hypothetical protein